MYRACDVGNAATVLTVLTVLSILAIGTIIYNEGVRAIGVGDSHLGAVGGGGGGYSGRDTVLAIGAVGAVGTIVYNKGVRAVGVGDGHFCARGDGGGRHGGREAGSTSCTLSAVMHHKLGYGAVGEIDGIGVVQAAGCRSRDGQDAASVLPVLAVLDGEGVGTGGVSDGHQSASCGGGCRHSGRDTVLSISTGSTCGALRSGGTCWTLRAGLTMAQHVSLYVAVGHGHHQHIARVGGRDRDGWNVTCTARIQGVRHAQQLLHALDAVIDATRRVYLRLQIERSLTPGDLGEVLAGVASAHLHGEQAVHVGGCLMGLRVHDRTRGAALQNGDLDRNVLFRH